MKYFYNKIIECFDSNKIKKKTTFLLSSFHRSNINPVDSQFAFLGNTLECAARNGALSDKI